MQELIINIVNQFGYIGILLLIAIENIFPPIPSEVILTFAGFMTTHTNMNVIGVIIFSTIGSVLGALILYRVGRSLTKERLEYILDGKIGRILHFKKDDVRKSEEWFIKRGNLTVFFCRFIPIIRSLISLPAGMTKMKLGIFLILTTAGTIIWNTVLVLLGVAFGTSWEKIVGYINTYTTITLIVICIGVIIAGIIFYKTRIVTKCKINNI
ncbi:MAG: DedA family protein [Clostridia bacterium]|nr:DedA family protein [Clostridia bacterium]MDD4386886.1 DedA family protein [Clostridia bacterium]